MPKVLKSRSHPGFSAIAKKIAKKEGLPIARADAILAASTRRDSSSAHRNNPHLNKVKGSGFFNDWLEKVRTNPNEYDATVYGNGWEDMLAEAMERDKQNEADKASANKIREAAAADSKKRTGGTEGEGLKRKRRKRCVTCRRKMPKSA